MPMLGDAFEHVLEVPVRIYDWWSRLGHFGGC